MPTPTPENNQSHTEELLEQNLQAIAKKNKELSQAERALSSLVRMDAELDQEQQDQQDMADLERMIQEA